MQHPKGESVSALLLLPETHSRRKEQNVFALNAFIIRLSCIWFFSKTKQRSCPTQAGVPVTPTPLSDKKVWVFHFVELSIVNRGNQRHGSVQFPSLVTKMKIMGGTPRTGPRLFDSLVRSQVLAESTTPRRTTIKAQVTLPLRMIVMMPMRKASTMELMTFKRWMVTLLHQDLSLK